MVKLSGKKTDQWLLGIGGGGELTEKGTRELLGVVDIVYILAVVVVTQLYRCQNE